MFFCITTDSSHPLLSKAHSGLYLDAGWTMSETNAYIDWRKGYSLESVLDDIDPLDSQRGHYCIIRFNKSNKQWNIYYDDLRGFPIFYNAETITNVPELLTDYKLRRDNFSLLPIKKLTLEEATDLVREALTNNIRDYLKYNNNKICLPPSGGYDSTVLQAIMDSEGIAYTKHIPFERLYFYDVWQPKHDSELMKHLRTHLWGYLQLRPAPEGMAIITGFDGDEFLMRNPGYVSYVCSARGLSLSEYIDNYDDQTYMTKYIRDRYLEKIKSSEEHVKTIDDLKEEKIIEILEQDFQMWHFDDTITILPWKSRNIIYYGFGLGTDDILDQLLNARIQHTIISELAPELLETITTYKNIYEDN